jgi:F-type H+-transporting ATPase subunit b
MSDQAITLGGLRRLRAAALVRRSAALLGAFALTALPAVLAAQEEHAPAAAGGEPSLFSPNLGLSIWTVVIFLALLGVLWKFAWGPILAAAATREQHIQQALDEAASRQAEAMKLMEQQKAQLADARRQVQEIIAEGKTAGERLRRELEEKARAEAQSIVERARKDITREKDVALDELRRESVELALAAAAKLMERKLDPQTDRELVLGYIDELSNNREGAKA